MKDTSHKRINIIWFHLSKASGVTKSVEIESTMVVPRGQGEGEQEVVVQWVEFPLCKIKTLRSRG